METACEEDDGEGEGNVDAQADLGTGGDAVGGDWRVLVETGAAKGMAMELAETVTRVVMYFVVGAAGDGDEEVDGSG